VSGEGVGGGQGVEYVGEESGAGEYLYGL